MKTLRKERETLLTLLEAFVYDPLVDWTVNDDGTAASAGRYTSAHAAGLSIAALKQDSLLAVKTINAANDAAAIKSELSLDSLLMRLKEILHPHWCTYR